MAEFGCNHIQSKVTIRLEVKFGRPLTGAVNMIVYSEYNSSIKVDRNRNVLANFHA
mgnify:CR=1 FL=1